MPAYPDVLVYKISHELNGRIESKYIAPDKDWKHFGIYPPLFGLIGYFKF